MFMHIYFRLKKSNYAINYVQHFKFGKLKQDVAIKSPWCPPPLNEQEFHQTELEIRLSDCTGIAAGRTDRRLFVS